MLPSLNEVKTMSSREIAELTGKRHDHVLVDIAKVLDEAEISDPKLRGTYTDSQNKIRPCFNLPRRECDLVIAGYSVKYRLSIIDRWQELELLQKPALPNYQEALRQLADQLDITCKQSLQLEAQKPAVEFVERYVDSTGNKGFREVCKLLNANERNFQQFVLSEKIMYRLGGKLTAYGNHIDAGRFEVNTGIADNEHAYTTSKFTPKRINWVAGLWAVHNLKG